MKRVSREIWRRTKLRTKVINHFEDSTFEGARDELPGMHSTSRHSILARDRLLIIAGL